LDVAGFGICLNTEAVVEKIGRDTAEGKRLGVMSTPTFFLGLVGDHEVTLTRKIVGLPSVDVFVQTIQELLKVSGTST
jgi:protein-disulfide isomerase